MGATPLTDVMRALDIEEFPNSENYETIAGFMMYSLRKIPKRTDFLVYAGYKFEIIDTENLKIDQLFGFQTRKYGGENVIGFKGIFVVSDENGPS